MSSWNTAPSRRHHATITFDADVAYISDIKSTHGTYVTTPDGGEERFLL